MIVNKWPKRCACGREHFVGEWSGLPLVGYLVTPEDEKGPLERLELRNCPCGSTISIEVPPEGPSYLLLCDLVDVFRVEAARTRGDLTAWQSGQFWRGEEARLDPNHFLPKQDAAEADRLDAITAKLEERTRAAWRDIERAEELDARRSAVERASEAARRAFDDWKKNGGTR